MFSKLFLAAFLAVSLAACGGVGGVQGSFDTEDHDGGPDRGADPSDIGGEVDANGDGEADVGGLV